MPLFKTKKKPKKRKGKGSSDSDQRTGQKNAKQSSTSTSTSHSETDTYQSAAYYEMPTYDNIEANHVLQTINSLDPKSLLRFWKQIDPSIRKQLIKSDIDVLSDDDRKKEADRNMEYLSDVENIIEDQLKVLTVQNLDAGEQFNTIYDRRDIQWQKLKKLEEKKKSIAAQRLLEKDPLNPQNEKKIRKLMSGEQDSNEEIRDKRYGEIYHQRRT